jgi:hypothetical protein
MKQGSVISLTVLSVNTRFTTGMRDGTLKAFDKNTSIEVARVKSERLRDGGRKPAEQVTDLNYQYIIIYINAERKCLQEVQRVTIYNII